MKKTVIFSIVLLTCTVCHVAAQSPTIPLTKADFVKKVWNFETSPNEWKYLGNMPCVIDFYASWCGPCKMIAPYLEELARTYAGKICIYKINKDKEQELAAIFGISSIPVLLFVPMKDTPQMLTGARPKATIEQAIKDILLK
jgi:thioredoxin